MLLLIYVENRTINQNNVLCVKGIILAQELLDLSSGTFCSVINLTPSEVTLQDISQSEVTTLIPVRMDSLALCVSPSKPEYMLNFCEQF